MKSILPMVDLKGQYHRIKPEIDQAVASTVASTYYVGGPEVAKFSSNLEAFLGVKHVIPCANGTDALQVAMMALKLEPGDEVIVPAFTYVATAEVIALLRLSPVMVDVDPHTFNIDLKSVEKAITSKTKAIVPVHLFGQCAPMEEIMAIAQKHNLFVIEDAAQSIGAMYSFSNGTKKSGGTIGHIGTTSFFPSKNLGCFGDGGAIFTNDDQLAATIRMIANHGQEERYYHSMIGVNSRLDAIQAAVLNVKLKQLDQFTSDRQSAADQYDEAFAKIDGLVIPERFSQSTHVFHQYTLKVKNGLRNALKEHLLTKGIASAIYYPVPLYKQKAYKPFYPGSEELPVTESLCEEVLSLPMHTELDKETQGYIINAIFDFFNAK